MSRRGWTFVSVGLLCALVGVAVSRQAPASAQLELDSGSIPNGGTYQHTFNSGGTFPYHCAIHAGTQGSVIVAVGGPPNASVTIVDGTHFVPSSVTVGFGGTVQWQNAGSTHTVTSDVPTPTSRRSWGDLKARRRR